MFNKKKKPEINPQLSHPKKGLDDEITYSEYGNNRVLYKMKLDPIDIGDPKEFITKLYQNSENVIIEFSDGENILPYGVYRENMPLIREVIIHAGLYFLNNIKNERTYKKLTLFHSLHEYKRKWYEASKEYKDQKSSEEIKEIERIFLEKEQQEHKT